jgi:methylated-DNA-[protein]-cysteine S-methyltransferase
MTDAWAEIDSPIGRVAIRVNPAGAVKEIIFRHAPEGFRQDPKLTDPAVSQLNEYFEGSRREFDLDLAPEGTEFQRQVWKELTKIPYAQTTSYGELARRLDRPDAARAVGAANGQNPISIVIPCHRVIGSAGQLTGYAGGLDTKQRLLNLETGAQTSLFD